MKVLMLYHSSVGNTKLVSKLIHSHLSQYETCDIFSIETIPKTLNYNDYDAYVIGFPTFHSRPSEAMINHFNAIKGIEKKKPAFIFTTCGWYSANALRMFIKLSLRKGIYPVMSRTYKCIATDGILIAPILKFLYDFDKKLPTKVQVDSDEFIEILDNRNYVGDIPKFKFYSVINYPNALLGQKYTFKIYLSASKCVQCGRCVKNCNVSAYLIDANGYPEFDRKKCENCYRCVHHCPKRALSIYKRRYPSLMLNDKFYLNMEKTFSQK